MHEIVFQIATVWMTGLLGVMIVFLIRTPSALTRILALDTVTLILIAVLILFADSNRSQYYLDAALILALLSFVSTIAAARFQSERETFS